MGLCMVKLHIVTALGSPQQKAPTLGVGPQGKFGLVVLQPAPQGGTPCGLPWAHLVQPELFLGICSFLPLATAPGTVGVTSDPLS